MNIEDFKKETLVKYIERKCLNIERVRKELKLMEYEVESKKILDEIDKLLNKSREVELTADFLLRHREMDKLYKKLDSLEKKYNMIC